MVGAIGGLILVAMAVLAVAAYRRWKKRRRRARPSGLLRIIPYWASIIESATSPP